MNPPEVVEVAERAYREVIRAVRDCAPDFNDRDLVAIDSAGEAFVLAVVAARRRVDDTLRIEDDLGGRVLGPDLAAAVYLWAIGDGRREPPPDQETFVAVGMGLRKLIEEAGDKLPWSEVDVLTAGPVTEKDYRAVRARWERYRADDDEDFQRLRETVASETVEHLPGESEVDFSFRMARARGAALEERKRASDARPSASPVERFRRLWEGR